MTSGTPALLTCIAYRVLSAAFLGLLAGWPAHAADAPLSAKELEKKTRQLDEQTQTLKREVLELGRSIAYLAWVGGVKPAGEAGENTRYQFKALSDETVRMGQALTRLEDGTLTPPGIQLVVFISLDTGAGMNVEEIALKIDNQLAMRRKYKTEEIDALRQGGTHRLYIGNVPEGRHRLEVSVTTQSGKKRPQTDNYSTTITKPSTRKTVEFHISSSFGGARLNATEWD